MVAPVTGPFSVVFNGGLYNTGSRTWYRQAKPYDLVLPFSFSHQEGKRRSWVKYYNYASDVTSRYLYNLPLLVNPSDARWTAANNRCYAKLKGKIGDTAGWAENLAQIQAARSMINGRFEQLATFVVHVKNGKFRKAARALRTPVPSGVSHKKAVSQNILEYEYGMKPLMSDIESSIKILGMDLGAKRIHASQTETYVSRTNTPIASPWAGVNVSELKELLSVRQYVSVEISNPNLFLAGQLGLLDLALPWKLIPFSFVVDWFVNVEQMISSVTDFYGLNLINPGTTRYTKGWYTDFIFEQKLNQAAAYYMSDGRETVYEGTSTTRSAGLSGPALVIKPFQGFSLERGIQACALILAVFGK